MRRAWAKFVPALLMPTLLMIHTVSRASEEPANQQLVHLTTECLAYVSQAYDVHSDVLLAILMVEGGTVGQNSRKNQNGTYDIGLFQINSMHRQALAQMGISEEELRNDGCLNAAVAAWHLRRTLTDEVLAGITDSESYLQAIARYHSATPKYNEIYAGRLRSAFDRLYSEGDAQ